MKERLLGGHRPEAERGNISEWNWIWFGGRLEQRIMEGVRQV